MFFLFFIYCNTDYSEIFLNPKLTQRVYNDSLKKIPNAASVNPINFLQDFSIFFTNNFEKFFSENNLVLDIKNLKKFFTQENISPLLLLYFKPEQIKDIDNDAIFMKFAVNIMLATQSQMLFAFERLLALETSYEKNKKNKPTIKESFSSYSIPLKFKDQINQKNKITQEQEFYTNFYKQNNKTQLFNYLNALVQDFISESFNQPSLKQKSELQKLILIYFLDKLHVDIINPFLYLVNKEKTTLSTQIDIKLAKENFLLFQKTYIKDNNLSEDFELNYNTIKKTPKNNEVDFVKYLFQQYPVTMYANFIETLFQGNKFNRTNFAFLIIMYNLKSFHQAFNDFQKEQRQ